MINRQRVIALHQKQCIVVSQNRKDKTALHKLCHAFDVFRVQLLPLFQKLHSDYEWEKIADGTAGDILRMTDQMNAYPARLGMYTNYKTLTPISDYAYIYEQNYGSSVTLAYNGKINRSRGCYVMDITGYMQQLWNSYMEAKADAGGEVANIDWDKVKNRSVYIGPEAYGLYTTSFGVLQGMPTQAGTAEPNNAPIRFSMAYNLIK